MRRTSDGNTRRSRGGLSPGRPRPFNGESPHHFHSLRAIVNTCDIRRRSLSTLAGVTFASRASRKLQEIVWSPGQESNLDLTLRRRVHCPLCYREVKAIPHPDLLPLRGRRNRSAPLSRAAGEGVGGEGCGACQRLRDGVYGPTRASQSDSVCLTSGQGSWAPCWRRLKPMRSLLSTRSVDKMPVLVHDVTVPSNVSNAP
jgi:hypothetical protein